METRRKPTPSALRPAANAAPGAGFFSFIPTTMPNKPTTPDWTTIRAQLTGMRLAIYDDLSQTASIRVGSDWTEEQKAALGWLHVHRFAFPHGFSDTWCGRPMAKAQELWEAEGEALAPAPGVSDKGEGVSDKPSTPPAAYGQQAQFFDLEGYKK